ncbi:hypothetical protein J4Q44_G00149150 [Coregonus suidteri]|uniref:Rab3 GTPase-activating protein catalytic subunit n=1 Tax=Coregonus suidteri TaxID=861788 RepID=A0AAN8M223_9TELE
MKLVERMPRVCKAVIKAKDWPVVPQTSAAVSSTRNSRPATTAKYRMMLNCCIERKRARDDGRKMTKGGKERKRERKVSRSTGTENGCLGPESAATVEGGREVSPGKSWDTWSDSEGEDEFFECLSDTEEVKDSPSTDCEKDGAKEDGAKAAKPEGRLHPHGKLTLLNFKEPLYIPVTQETAPMTEDLLEEQSEVLAKLGTSAEGAHLRARMQSACLLSVMESFKATNPGCTLEDFVRWYSPRDYVEEEVVVDESGDTVVRGDLSARMKIPGNMWMEAWATAKTTPCSQTETPV